MLNIGLKHHKNVISYIAPFEYEVFPVVRKSSNITRISQLQGKKFCHTGYGYQPLLSKVISEVNIFIVVKQHITVDHIISYNHSICHQIACFKATEGLHLHFHRALSKQCRVASFFYPVSAELYSLTCAPLFMLHHCMILL
jgi:hypothetical protein